MNKIIKCTVSMMSLSVVAGCAYISPYPDSRPQTRKPNEDVVTYPADNIEYTISTEAPKAEQSTLNRTAVIDLVEKSDWHFRAGNFVKSESTLERAIRLEPQNANLWHRLAKIKLAKGQPSEAERFAEKSNSLAHSNRNQLAANWLLIAESRRLAGDNKGALEAEARAHGVSAR